jgi:hypothetical protein
MLTLNHLHITKNLYLFRETPEFIKSVDSTLDANKDYLLDIPELASAIIKYINNVEANVANVVGEVTGARDLSKLKEKGDNEINRITDYIFMCFLLGNDFMPHFPALNIRTVGIDILLNVYRETIGKTNSYLTDGKKIVWKNLHEFLENIAKQEYTLLMDEHKKRDKFARRFAEGGGGGWSGRAGAGGGGVAGISGVGNPPPNSGKPPVGSVSPPAGGGVVVPVVEPYNLSILAKIPVLGITVGVAANSAPTAISILCCCRSSLISSSDIPRICFLAQEIDTGAIFCIYVTASLYTNSFSFQTSNPSKSACLDGLDKPNVKLSNSSSKPSKNKCIIATLFNSDNILF